MPPRRVRAGWRYRRPMASTRPPYGFDDMPGHIVGALCTVTGTDTPGGPVVEAGTFVPIAAPAFVAAGTRWDLRNPAAAAFVEAHRANPAELVEVDLRVALWDRPSTAPPFDTINAAAYARWAHEEAQPQETADARPV